MTGDTKPPSRPGGERADRTAKALRANLQRRKQQLRGRRQSTTAERPPQKAKEPDRPE